MKTYFISLSQISTRPLSIAQALFEFRFYFLLVKTENDQLENKILELANPFLLYSNRTMQIYIFDK